MKSLASRADYEALVSSYDTWMFDCDGVLWHGDRLIEGAVDVLSHLRSQSACIVAMQRSQQTRLTPRAREEHHFRDEQRNKVAPELQGKV